MSMKLRSWLLSVLLAAVWVASAGAAVGASAPSSSAPRLGTVAPLRPPRQHGAGVALFTGDLPSTWRVVQLEHAAVALTALLTGAACLAFWALHAALSRRRKLVLRLRLRTALDLHVGLRLHLSRHLYLRAVVVGRPQALRLSTWWQRLLLCLST